MVDGGPGAAAHENRTRFPNLQEAAGAYNAKEAYLAESIAQRVGLRRFRSVTHVMVCLWTSEVIHSLRLHPETFRSLAPHPTHGFESWWSGTSSPRGTTSTLILIDPLASGRERTWLDLDAALTNARPRHAGYGAVAAKLGLLAKEGAAR